MWLGFNPWPGTSLCHGRSQKRRRSISRYGQMAHQNCPYGGPLARVTAALGNYAQCSLRKPQHRAGLCPLQALRRSAGSAPSLVAVWLLFCRRSPSLNPNPDHISLAVPPDPIQPQSPIPFPVSPGNALFLREQTRSPPQKGGVKYSCQKSSCQRSK